MKKIKNLEKIKNFLISFNLKLSKNVKDGRINSSINEEEVLKIIKTQFPIIKTPKIREWYDFSIIENKKFYPVNIKISSTTQADNLNCKLGIYFALTGKTPSFTNEISWFEYFKKLKSHIKKTNNDYYFLVINKNNPNDIFINSLKSLTDLQPNGNNLPFQCEWDKNRVPVNRTYQDAKRMILSTFGKSIKLRADIYFIFKKIFKKESNLK